MKKVKLTDNFEVSPLIHGHWRLQEWNFSDRKLLKLTEQLIELGITTFDHADIYGNYSCEQLFGNALALNKNLRNNIQIITKCGIKPVSNRFPKRQTGYYDYSFDHIISSVNNSLENFKTGHIDLLLLHRPSPFFNPEEVAEAFYKLKQQGKVLHFGVSNFNPDQYEMLNGFLKDALVTNQVEISPYCLDHFDNGNIEFFLKKKIKPLAWSPLAGGKILNPESEKEKRIFSALSKVADELEVKSIDKVVYSWLYKHPAHVIPILGSGKISRIKKAIEAFDIEMSTEQWFEIYIASLGQPLP